jgi:hypothetical protein
LGCGKVTSMLIVEFHCELDGKPETTAHPAAFPHDSTHEPVKMSK